VTGGKAIASDRSPSQMFFYNIIFIGSKPLLLIYNFQIVCYIRLQRHSY
jgi:hypothetical protein